MTAFQRFRGWHWLLALSLLAVYLTGDDAERAHIWLGYGLILLLVLRVLAVPLRLRGVPVLLPPRTGWRKPAFGRWLTFGALASFAIASLTGLGMVDDARVLGVSFGSRDLLAGLGDEDSHELFANLGLTLVALHIGHVLLFRNAFALAMLRGQPGAGSASHAGTFAWVAPLAVRGRAVLSRAVPAVRAFARRSMSRGR